MVATLATFEFNIVEGNKHLDSNLITINLAKFGAVFVQQREKTNRSSIPVNEQQHRHHRHHDIE